MVEENEKRLNIIKMWIDTSKGKNETPKDTIASIEETFGITKELGEELYEGKEKTISFLVKCVKRDSDSKMTCDEICRKYAMFKLENTIKYLLTEDEEINKVEPETETEDEGLIDTTHDVSNTIDNFSWRSNQIRAIENTVAQNFKSGIHNQIMGAGKTYIIFGIIQKNFELINKKCFYVILCDRQEVLRQMLFDKNGMIDATKKEKYKKFGVIDLNAFDIIDCVNKKPKNVFNVKLMKPTIVFINNAFLKVRDNVLLTSTNTGMILLDECHSISANQIYDLLHKLKYEKEIPIIGFSATPLREKAEKKLQDIFSMTMNDKHRKTLNIISTYDYVQSLQDGITLPFKYYYVEVPKSPKKSSVELITKRIVDDVCKHLPYKKIIAWCGTIEKMKEWYKFFTTQYPEFHVYMTSCKDKTLCETYNCDYNAFCEEDKNSILLCVNKCREGVDIKHVDCGMYLDAVKNRTILVCMQTSGRIIRPDKEGKKTRAVVVDMFVSSENSNIEIMTMKRIIGYYLQILNLVDEDIYDYRVQRELYDKICKLNKNMIVDENKNLITIKVDDVEKHNTKIKLELTQKIMDWGLIKSYLEKEIDKKFKVKREEKFNMVVEKIKKSETMKIDSDFWKVYDSIKDGLGLPDDFYNEYVEKFEKKSWYELLGFDTDCWYSNIKSLSNAISKKNTGMLTQKKYDKMANENENFPPYPHYLFRCKTFEEFVTKYMSKNYDTFV